MSLLQIEKRQAGLSSFLGMQIPLGADEVAYLCGRTGTFAVAKALGKFFYLETQADEIVLFTEPEDLMVASSFGVGKKIRRGLRCTIYQLRELDAPLIVLPKGHPASPRLKSVISIGPRTTFSCRIQPGTHPEQDVLCGPEEFHGMEVLANPGGAEIAGYEEFSGEIIVEKL
ncbi:MAG: hypothetical protein A4E48_02073 [Methanosaeta sp. PtaU1.Bin060]|nr:MAG: hypothetical protein A4E48_02073 [Methanosaeta sp. PtaU1.Bin060]